MTQLNPGAIALRVIALTSAVTISACLVVREQDRADQAEQNQRQINELEKEAEDRKNLEDALLSAEQPLSGPPAPGETQPAENFLHSSKAMMPPEIMDPARFFPSSKSAEIDMTPEIFLSTSKSLSISPSHSGVDPLDNGYEASLRQREQTLSTQLEAIRAELKRLEQERTGGR